MARPTLQDLAQVAEIVAAVAVVVSLVYVGREVQSNTAAIRGAAMQEIATADADALITIAADSALSEIIRRGSEDADQLSVPDAFRFSLYVRNFWLSFQNIYQQSALDLVDASVWESYRLIICSVGARPGFVQLWPEEREVLDPEFVAVVEACN
jgi:hypothetical protein